MINNRLLKIRLEFGYKTQQEFADFLGLDRWIYNRYENNKVQPSGENLLLICEKTGKRIEEIICRVSE